MTDKEALKLLEDHEYWADFSYLDEMAITAAEALEKQTPKKPIGVYCPVCTNDCDTDADTPFPNYCPNCGQALDWSEEL